MINNKWDSVLIDEYEKPYFIKLQKFLDNEYRERTIFPKRQDIFNAYRFCDYDNVKVVIIGQDPYHDFNQANGLAFSVQKGVKIPPSLRNIFKELKSDLGIDIPTHGDLTSWAKQGVFLINSVLTVEAHQPASHKNIGWENFIKATIEQISNNRTNIIFVLWGNHAKEYLPLIEQKKHLVLMSSHPSPLSARHSFFGSKVFSKINDYLKKTNQNVIDFKIEKNLLDF